MKKELGGKRLGNGSKMEVAMKNYERSTHNLSRVWRSSMATGVLTPCFSEIALNGDTWKINLDSVIRTLPTVGPLFGSFKFQVDFFVCPIRLYQGLLHNNAVRIGLKMDKVYMPTITMLPPNTSVKQDRLINPSSLAHFLGLKERRGALENYNALKFLAYYDIFKNYYANTQEANFKLISGGELLYAIPSNYAFSLERTSSQGVTSSTPDTNTRRGYAKVPAGGDFIPIPAYTGGTKKLSGVAEKIVTTNITAMEMESGVTITESKGEASVVNLSADTTNIIKGVNLYITINKQAAKYLTLAKLANLLKVRAKNADTPITLATPISVTVYDNYDTSKRNSLYPRCGEVMLKIGYQLADGLANAVAIGDVINTKLEQAAMTQWAFPADNEEPKIIDVPLENIDKARREILKKCELGDKVNIGEGTVNAINFEPYITNSSVEETGRSKNAYPLNGLVLKTYNSDLFNNWLDKEQIDGTDGVNALAEVEITENKLSLDALNLKQKIYNMLNRVVACGSTYEDWQEAIWGEEAIRRAESPIYQGGMSGEIVFEEVVSSAESETSMTGNQPIGTLAGKGILKDKKGGEIEIDIKEPSIIMGIASITPRVDYSQGISWDLVEIKTLDDLHKPEMDGIGFQNLPAYWMFGKMQKNLMVGKQPAWIQYMTAVNEVHGDFADEDGAAFMTLQKRFEFDEKGAINFTTYIDPVMFNSAFAVQSLSAQNFWVQIGVEAIARRKMSAKIIPNL